MATKRSIAMMRRLKIETCVRKRTEDTITKHKFRSTETFPGSEEDPSERSRPGESEDRTLKIRRVERLIWFDDDLRFRFFPDQTKIKFFEFR